ncbi:sensor histidine kinase [Pelagicoccus albus]|uniref:histidine kinase n=1 Tax=Pelagicoccus albus TaxID=415222 RepID=A0A7X1B4H4_9BACT|nr:sensor histidine kinase [Pelagicoccus albus]MBC2605472.1 sensor histidine kinase [Pelagicoccus albus]
MQENTTQKRQITLCQLADQILERRPSILKTWKQKAASDGNLEVISSISSREFLDHVPQILDIMDGQIRSIDTAATSYLNSERTRKMEYHGLSRWQQGFSITEVVRDWNHLRNAIIQEIAQIVDTCPEFRETSLNEVANVLSELIAEGINSSVAKYEEIRQAEAKGHLIDLNDSIEKLQELSQQQALVYREASHDLAGTLGILSSMTQIFHRNSKHEELKNLYEPLAEGLSTATQILEDMRVHSKLEAGQAIIKYETVDAAELMRKILTPYLLVAKDRGIQFEVSGPESLVIETDQAQLTRILQNLMHNALKFTQEGEIEVKWGKTQEDGNWFATIQNSGVLSPPESSLPIGEKMINASISNPHGDSQIISSKLNDQTDRIELPTGDHEKKEEVDTELKVPRSGIGLSIAKRLCGILHGRLDVSRNKDDYGVTASMFLPVRPPRP